jgi:hypothetical protein
MGSSKLESELWKAILYMCFTKQFRFVLKFPSYKFILFVGRIFYLAQCNQFKNKHLNNPACHMTQYHSILLLSI